MRLTVIIIAALLAFAGPALAREDAPSTPPKATIADAAWLAGRWTGEGMGGTLSQGVSAPVGGQMASYFGSPRAEGGTTWKGLFIRAPEGEQVHAVAAGTIVFADWLRGFGNLLIIDHGDDFLSIYANNGSLAGTAGAAITAGQVIATAGNSGGNPDSGLYFELRHQGRAFDPLKWIGTR